MLATPDRCRMGNSDGTRFLVAEVEVWNQLWPRISTKIEAGYVSVIMIDRMSS